MSIEAMKKDDLVKEVRTLTQSMKILEQENAQLKEQLSTSSSSSSEVKEEDLPFTAVSTIIVGKNRCILVKVKFDKEGNSKVEEIKDVPDANYKVIYQAEKFLHTVIAYQKDETFLKEEK